MLSLKEVAQYMLYAPRLTFLSKYKHTKTQHAVRAVTWTNCLKPIIGPLQSVDYPINWPHPFSM